MARHFCGMDDWHECCVCDGRIHLPGCTTRPRVDRDCCPARHKMLFNQGKLRGLADTSHLMWTPEHPRGVHFSDYLREVAQLESGDCT